MEFCRLCAQQKPHMMPVKELDIKNNVQMLLQICIGDSDTLPQSICLDCLSKLNQFREFHSMSNQSQLILSIIFKKAIAEEKPRNEVVVIKAPSPKAPTQPKLLTYNATTNVTAPKQMKIQIEQYEDDQIEGNVEEFIVAEYEEEPEMIEVDEQYEECEESEESEEEYIAPKPRAKKKASVVTVMKLQKPNKSTVGSPVESKSLMKIKQENSLKALGASPKPRRNEFKQLICYICNLKFGSNLILMQHFKSDHKDKPLQYTCVYCPETVFTLYRSFTRHVMNHTNSHRFSCEICNKTFAQHTGLDQHLTTHSNDRNFVCSLCDISFKQRASLFKHNKQRHENKTKPTCIKCSKSFMSKETLEQHIKSKHSELMQKDINCNVCDQKFASKTALNYHTLSHTKMSTKFPCTNCKKSFKTKTLLKNHAAQHHKHVDE